MDYQRMQNKLNDSHRCLLAILLLTLLVNIPMLLLNTDTVFIDDWAVVWIHFWKGPAGLQEVFWQLAHAWFGPLNNFLFLVGGDVPGRFARILATIFHLMDGYLLWLIFRTGRGNSAFAVIIAALYLASPYLGGPRATFNLYDVSIFFYLVSILLSARNGLLSLVASLIAIVLGLSIETLAALEPIRWWLFYRSGFGLKTILLRAIPYLIVVAAVAVSRATWMAPYGEFYGGHNSIRPFVLREFINYFDAYVRFFIDALRPTRYVVDLIKYDSLFIPMIILLFAGGIGFWQSRIKRAISLSDGALLLFLGAGVLFLGILPYILVLKAPPTWTGFYGYLAVASQFGALIIAAAIITFLPGSVFRGAVLAFAVFVFSGMQLQYGKWAMYDGQVVKDFRAQLAEEFKNHSPELLFVKFKPASYDLLFMKACLANYDVMVPLDIRNLRNGSYAYDQDCGAQIYTEDGKCGVTAYERFPCPPKRNAEFLINPGMSDFTRFRLFDLTMTTLYRTPLKVGRLVVNRSN